VAGRKSSWLAAGLAMLLAAGCSSSSDPATSDAGPSGGGDCFACTDAGGDVPAALRVKGVLDQVCANADGCHGAGAGGLSISRDSEYASLIGVRSTEVPSLYRVMPGDPAQSYAYLKLACEGGIAGSCMPLGGHLDLSLLEAFHEWIEAGAPTQ
jgi:hypothetical protein